MNKRNMLGDMNIATTEPIAWAYHCRIGGVRRRKPSLKSDVRSVLWDAAPDAMAPPIRFSLSAAA